MAKAYIIIIGDKGSEFCGFHKREVFLDALNGPSRECLYMFNDNGGGFVIDHEAMKKSHIYRAWLSGNKAIWIEKLEIVE